MQIMRFRKTRAGLLGALILSLVMGAAAALAEETYTNSIGMEFVLIPAGSFMMGAPESDNKYKKVIPANYIFQHKVTISKPFYLGKYEVTQAQWMEVMGNNPSEFKGENNPVETVSWEDVQVFIQKLNQKEGTDKYRLPTEAEWEYAARAGTAGPYYFGDNESDLGDYAWYKDNAGGASRPVGQKKPNPWGLFDMHGNIWEWAADWHGMDYYPNSPEVDPPGPASYDKDIGKFRVLRGGDWTTNAYGCRSWYRGSNLPGARFGNFGFRLARSAGK
jgi:formylglycine-generating enzyme required for sulfatase activity